MIGQVLKKMPHTYSDKVEGQQAVSDKKAQLIYDAPNLRLFPNSTGSFLTRQCGRVSIYVSGLPRVAMLMPQRNLFWRIESTAQGLTLWVKGPSLSRWDSCKQL